MNVLSWYVRGFQMGAGALEGDKPYSNPPFLEDYLRGWKDGKEAVQAARKAEERRQQGAEVEECGCGEEGCIVSRQRVSPPKE